MCPNKTLHLKKFIALKMANTQDPQIYAAN